MDYKCIRFGGSQRSQVLKIQDVMQLYSDTAVLQAAIIWTRPVCSKRQLPLPDFVFLSCSAVRAFARRSMECSTEAKEEGGSAVFCAPHQWQLIKWVYEV